MAITLADIANALIGFEPFHKCIKNEVKGNSCFDGFPMNFGKKSSYYFIKTFFYFANASMFDMHDYSGYIKNGFRNNKNQAGFDYIFPILNAYADENLFSQEEAFIENLIQFNIYYSIGKTKEQAREHPRYLRNDDDSKANYDTTANSLAMHLRERFKAELETTGLKIERVTGNYAGKFVVYLIGTALMNIKTDFHNKNQAQVDALKIKIKNNISKLAKKCGFGSQADSLEPYFQELLNNCLELQYKKSKGSKNTNNPFAKRDLDVERFFKALVPQKFNIGTPLKQNSALPIRLYITSDSGSGKSTFTNSVCLLTCIKQLNIPIKDARSEIQQNSRSLFGEENDAGFIPVLVIASKANHQQNEYRLEELFFTGQPDLIKQHLDSDKLLLLIDGLDEVTQSNQKTLLNEILRFIEDHPQVHVVITSRFAGNIPALGIPAFSNYGIEAFSMEDIESLSKKALSPEAADEFVQTCNGNPFIKEFVSNPYKLTIALDYFNEQGKMKLTDLIHYYVERHYYARQEELKQLFRGTDDNENKKIYFDFLKYAAFGFVSQKKEAITPEHLKELLLKVMPDLFRSYPVQKEAEQPVSQKTFTKDEKGLIHLLNEQSTTGLEDNHIQTIKSISIVSGILRLNQNNCFEFQDSLVMDYLAAVCFLNRIEKRLQTTSTEQHPVQFVSRARHNPLSIAYAVGIIANIIIAQEEQVKFDDINLSKDFLTALAMVISYKDADYLIQLGIINTLFIMYRHSDDEKQKQMIETQIQYIAEQKYGSYTAILKKQLQNWGINND